jgi:hypothetical protein
MMVTLGVTARCKASPAVTKSHVAAAEAMTTAKATPVAAAAGTDQNEWAARCTPWLLLLGAAEIARLCERRGVRESKRKKC